MRKKIIWLKMVEILRKLKHFQKVLLRASYQSRKKKYQLRLLSLIATLLKIADIFKNKRNKFQLFKVSEDAVKKDLSCLHVWIRHAGMDQIPANFPKEAADVLAYSLSKIIHLLVIVSFFPKESKTF